MKLTVIITTMDDNIITVVNNLVPQLKKVDEIIISHQLTKKSEKPYKKKLPKNVIYSSILDKGLSKNRNNGLKLAKGDICIICDDDVSFVKDFEKIVITAFNNHPNTDIITFESINEEGILRKKYSQNPYSHNWKTLLTVSSIEIAFRRKSILKNKISFNEHFGLGTKNPSGEENIFLKEAIDKNLLCKFIPKVINIHPQESSGNNIDWKNKKDLFKQLFGTKGIFLYLALKIKKKLNI